MAMFAARLMRYHTYSYLIIFVILVNFRTLKGKRILKETNKKLFPQCPNGLEM